jgi:hypothetical protein
MRSLHPIVAPMLESTALTPGDSEVAPPISNTFLLVEGRSEVRQWICAVATGASHLRCEKLKLAIHDATPGATVTSCDRASRLSQPTNGLPEAHSPGDEHKPSEPRDRGYGIRRWIVQGPSSLRAYVNRS